MMARTTTVILVFTSIAILTVLRQASFVKAAAEYLPKPSIESDTYDHVPLGKPIRLTCTVDIRAGALLSMVWKVPPNNRNAAMNDRIKVENLTVPQENEPHQEMMKQVLTIDAVTLEDKGTYRCEVSNEKGILKNREYTLYVRNTSDDYVILSEENRLTEIIMHKGQSVNIIIQYRSYPRNMTVYWTKDNHKMLTESTHNNKYTFNNTYKQYSTHNDLLLTINDATVNDTGLYTVTVTAGSAHANYSMPVRVKEKPIAYIDGDKIVKSGETVDFICRGVGYPVPAISFMFKPCLEESWQNCSKMATPASVKWDSSSPDIVSEHTPRTTASSTKETPIASSRTYRIIANQPGIVYCKVSNSEGSDTVQSDLLVSDLSDRSVTGTS